MTLALASGLLNALWTSQIKGRAAAAGPLAFAAHIRLGVSLCFLPCLVLVLGHASAHWWAYTCASGVLESLSLVLMVRGFQDD